MLTPGTEETEERRCEGARLRGPIKVFTPVTRRDHDPAQLHHARSRNIFCRLGQKMWQTIDSNEKCCVDVFLSLMQDAFYSNV